MKKTIYIILALCSVLALCCFNAAAAPAGTPITSATDFASMSANGNYYLANDIIIDTSYAGEFRGTFDGNGKTITVYAPIFTAIDGATIKNLNVTGIINGTGGNTAAVAVSASGAVTFSNVTTKVTIVEALGAGSLLAVADDTAYVTVTNCVNEGTISGFGTIGGLVGLINNNVATVTGCVNKGKILSTGGQSAGIVSAFGVTDGVAPKDTITIDNCVNYADITGDYAQSGGILAFLCGGAVITNCKNYGNILNTNNKAGGIFGTTINTTKNVCALTIENCINYGDVCASKVVAGIAARLGRAVQVEGMNYSINNCVNYGKLTTYTAITYYEKSNTLYMGGIAGYAYGGSLIPANSVTNCINFGDIVADSSHLTADSSLYIGGIIAYVNSSNYICKNNINVGNINYKGTLAPTAIALIVYNKATSPEEANNFSSDALPGANFNDTLTTVVTPEQLASGEVAFAANEAAGKTIFYQTIGSDKVPLVFADADGSNTVVKNADGSFSNVAKDTATTEPEVIVTPSTGDATLIFAVIAFISIIGTAVVTKRIKN